MPYQVGSFAVGNRLLAPEQRTGAGRRRCAPTRSPRAIAPARAAARRSAPATCVDAAMRASDGR